ncbi:hypothetical protein PR048_007764 [Dryococelus australis]|uniref:Uncharacterized protein n=1 Tax=Dryococelus australis TaxID=614101 RepID=A0ABQ9HVK4_9NEOP|nr:hypothetical protein PR048_007764 [Dryococelus australis]
MTHTFPNPRGNSRAGTSTANVSEKSACVIHSLLHALNTLHNSFGDKDWSQKIEGLATILDSAILFPSPILFPVVILFPVDILFPSAQLVCMVESSNVGVLINELVLLENKDVVSVFQHSLKKNMCAAISISTDFVYITDKKYIVQPMSVIEASMEQRRNEGTGETGIVRHMRNRAVRCRWSAGFLRGSPVSPTLTYRRCSIFTWLHPHRLSRPRCLEPAKSLHSLIHFTAYPESNYVVETKSGVEDATAQNALITCLKAFANASAGMTLGLSAGADLRNTCKLEESELMAQQLDEGRDWTGTLVCHELRGKSVIHKSTVIPVGLPGSTIEINAISFDRVCNYDANMAMNGAPRGWAPVATGGSFVLMSGLRWAVRTSRRCRRLERWFRCQTSSKQPHPDLLIAVMECKSMGSVSSARKPAGQRQRRESNPDSLGGIATHSSWLNQPILCWVALQYQHVEKHRRGKYAATNELSSQLLALNKCLIPDSKGSGGVGGVAPGFSWGHGDRVVNLLASHQGDPGSIPGRATPDFRMWESCRTMPLVGGFSRGSPVSPAPSFRRCSIFTTITLIGSHDLAVKSRPDLSTPVDSHTERRTSIHSDDSNYRTHGWLHHRGSKLDLRSYLRLTQKTVAPFEFRAGLEIEIKFFSNHRNWWFEITIRDQELSSTKAYVAPSLHYPRVSPMLAGDRNASNGVCGNQRNCCQFVEICRARRLRVGYRDHTSRHKVLSKVTSRNSFRHNSSEKELQPIYEETITQYAEVSASSPRSRINFPRSRTITH